MNNLLIAICNAHRGAASKSLHDKTGIWKRQPRFKHS